MISAEILLSILEEISPVRPIEIPPGIILKISPEIPPRISSEVLPGMPGN